MIDRALCLRITGVFLLSAVISGVYPALVLSRLRPMAILKGRYSFSRNGLWLRKGLVTFRFAISLLLIAGTLAVYRQLSFMNDQDLGVDIEQTVVLKAPVGTSGYQQKAAALKTALLGLPGVTGVSGSGAVPGKEVGEFLANRRFGAPKEEERTYEMLKADDDFIPLYGLTVIAGRAFDKGRPADSTGLVLNEAAVRQFGFTSPETAIGQKIWLEVNPGRPNTVIGVIRDYHQQSLRQAYTPLILFMDPAYPWIPTNDYSVKVNAGQITGTVKRIRQIWKEIFPESSFDFFFLNDYYNRQYLEDRQFEQLFGLFSSLAILIACMGLFGLTAYTVARRTKEVGVRKVLGASMLSVLGLLTWDSVQLVLPAGMLALPLAFWLIVQWLQGYAFLAVITWWQFAAPVGVLVGITLLTTGYLALRAARANPVRAIREE
jgi:putative ABC transport system permease protein